MSDDKKNDSGSSLTPVVIRGETYNIRSEEAPEYIESLVEFVDSKMETIAEATGTKDDRKLAILVALNLADEYFKLEKDREASARDVEDVFQDLASQLESSLRESGETSKASGL